MTYKLVTDGSTDMNVDFIKQSDIIVIPMMSTMEGETYSFLSSDVEKLHEYYEYMLDDRDVFSSQVNQLQFEECFTKILDEGFDIIYAGLTSGLSGTYQNAMEVTNKLKEKYPERKIAILEVYSACTGNGVLFQQLEEYKRNGMSFEDMVTWINDHYKYITAQFGVDDLKYLYKGGRVSKTTAGVGNLLKVKPLLHIDMDGKLQILSLNRGKKNTMKNLLKNFENSWMPEISKKVLIGYAYYEENAVMLKEMLEEKFPEAEASIAPIGSLIGTHVGPGMYSLCYFGNDR